ncbi:unnamed protein product, partial [Ectocarpus sp. 8 AP-2014]
HDVVDAEEAFSRKDEVLLNSVLLWFNEEESRVQTFSDIVHHKNGLSLRIIDWLITNFTKSFSVAIESDGLPRNLRRDYRKNLSAHNKKNFDPFARRRRIHIVLLGKEKRVSTIGQLNFFRWFLSKNLVGFLLENKSVIEKHMKDSDTNQDRAVKRKQAVSQLRRENNRRHSLEKISKKTKPGVCVAEPQLFSGSFKMSF